MSQIVSQPINEEWTTSVRSLESHSRQRRSPAEELRVDGEVLVLPAVCLDCMAVRGARALVATIQSEAGFRHRRNKDDKR